MLQYGDIFREMGGMMAKLFLSQEMQSVLTSITYGEDDDAEDVSAEELLEGMSNFNQPCGPLLPVHHSPLPKERTQPLSPYSPQLLGNQSASSASSSGSSTKPTVSPTQP